MLCAENNLQAIRQEPASGKPGYLRLQFDTTR